MSQRHGLRVLVTGASGLLGAGVARRLVSEGADVVTLQRRPSEVPGARDVTGSVTDREAVERAMTGRNTVVHVAAKVSVSGPAGDYERVNIAGTERVLESARRAGVERFVHVSSPSVAHAGTSIIGDGAGPADPQRARGHYARTKAAGELLALAADAQDFRVLVLRPHLMWGPGDAQLTERIIERARAGRMPLLGPSAALIDSLYTENAVDAVVAAVDAVDRVHGESLVVTNGEPRPVGELIRGLAVAGGAPEPRLRIPAGPARVAGGLIERLWDAGGLGRGGDEPPMTRFLAEQLSTAHWFDQRRTRTALRWVPAISIDDGLRRLAAYYSDRSGRR